MGITIYSDLKIYNDQFQTGFYDKVTQMIDAFNSKSNGAIVLMPEIRKGHYEQFAYFKKPANLVTRQDITSNSPAAPLKVEQDEKNSIKINRKIGPVDYTKKSLKLAGIGSNEFSFNLGQMIGEEVVKDKLNTAIRALVGFLKGITANGYSGALAETTKTMMHKYLLKSRATLGDQYNSLAMWLFHSKPFHDLIAQALTDNVYNVAGLSVIQGTTATFNLPSLVTDSPDLVNTPSSGADQYYTLGLCKDAVKVKETEELEMTIQTKTGNEQVEVEMQGEYAYNIQLKDAAFDLTKINPTDAQLAASANWTSKAPADKMIGSCWTLTN
jgi:hypothetical protein